MFFNKKNADGSNTGKLSNNFSVTKNLSLDDMLGKVFFESSSGNSKLVSSS